MADCSPDDPGTGTAAAPKPKATGRRCLLNQVRHDAIVEASRHGLDQTLVAFAAGISTRTLRSWLREGRKATSGKFHRLWEATKGADLERIRSLLKTVVDAAQPHEVRVTKTVTLTDGTTRVEETVTTDRGRWQAAAWALERQYAEFFALPNVRDLQEIRNEDRKFRREQKKRKAAAADVPNRFDFTERDREELEQLRAEKMERVMAERKQWFIDHGMMPADEATEQTAEQTPPPPDAGPLFDDD